MNEIIKGISGLRVVVDRSDDSDSHWQQEQECSNMLDVSNEVNIIHGADEERKVPVEAL